MHLCRYTNIIGFALRKSMVGAGAVKRRRLINSADIVNDNPAKLSQHTVVVGSDQLHSKEGDALRLAVDLNNMHLLNEGTGAVI